MVRLVSRQETARREGAALWLFQADLKGHVLGGTVFGCGEFLVPVINNFYRPARLHGKNG